jgi:hypothetical protein
MHNKVPCSKAKLSKNTLFHERTRKDKIFKHVQKFASSFLTLKVPQAYPVPQVRPPSVISGADPKCNGLTCFSKTENERKVPANFSVYDDRPPSLKQKQQPCTAKCYIQAAKKGHRPKIIYGRNMRANPCMLYVFIFAVLR